MLLFVENVLLDMIIFGIFWLGYFFNFFFKLVIFKCLYIIFFKLFNLILLIIFVWFFWFENMI